jgi:hypothetical protein
MGINDEKFMYDVELTKVAGGKIELLFSWYGKTISDKFIFFKKFELNVKDLLDLCEFREKLVSVANGMDGL